MPQAPAARVTGAKRGLRLSARTQGVFRSAARVLATALMFVSAGTSAQSPAVPQQGLPLTELTAGMHRIVAEVAADHASRATGLMYRRSLAPSHGMLFVFQDKSPKCFWMRNTLMPLSIAFLDDDGRIVNIEDMAPMTENSHCSREPVRFALEMEQGWFQRRGVNAGDRLGGREVFKLR